MLLDPEGRPLVNTGQPLGAQMPPGISAKTVEAVTRTRATVVSNLSPGGAAQPYATTLAIPVPLENGQRYVLATAFSPAHFNPVLTPKRHTTKLDHGHHRSRWQFHRP